MNGIYRMTFLGPHFTTTHFWFETPWTLHCTRYLLGEINEQNTGKKWDE